jgi:uncharacterized damage-inducible protein DinB
MKKIASLVLLMLLTVVANTAKAQSLDQMVSDWERAKSYTKEYLDAMPEEGYAFKPSPEMKTFADQMLHFTDANYELAPLAGGIKSPIADGASIKSLDKSKAATIKMVMDGYDFVIKNIKNLKPEQFQQKVKVFNKFEMTKVILFSKIFEHQTHHRGQTTVYFHLKGLTPPDQKLF